MTKTDRIINDSAAVTTSESKGFGTVAVRPVAGFSAAHPCLCAVHVGAAWVIR